MGIKSKHQWIVNTLNFILWVWKNWRKHSFYRWNVSPLFDYISTGTIKNTIKTTFSVNPSQIFMLLNIVFDYWKTTRRNRKCSFLNSFYFVLLLVFLLIKNILSFLCLDNYWQKVAFITAREIQLRSSKMKHIILN